MTDDTTGIAWTITTIVTDAICLGYLRGKGRDDITTPLTDIEGERVFDAVKEIVEDALQDVLPLVGAAAAAGSGWTTEELHRLGLVRGGGVPVELVTELVNRVARMTLTGEIGMRELRIVEGAR